MITCFPDPHPDELMFSVCARYDDIMAYPNRSAAAKDLFGYANTHAVVELPGRLNHLVSSLPPNHRYTVDDFIDNNTLLPFYEPFIPSHRADVVRAEMRRESKGHAFERLGLTVFRLKPSAWLRFCPSCVAADKQEFRETYWHRIHQVTGVEVCPHHGVFLEESDVPRRNTRYPNKSVSAERSVRAVTPRPVDPTNQHHTFLLHIARNVAWLLQWRGHLPQGVTLRDRYYNILLKRGLAHYNGNIKNKEFQSVFISFYSPEFLESMQYKIGTQVQNWLVRLVTLGKSNRAQHPLGHILLMIFLGCTAEEVFTQFKEYKPFGDGPWPCLNHTCENFKQPVISRCRVTGSRTKGSRERPMGLFRCDCGFSYTRRGPDTAEGDKFRAESVQSYGPVWEDLLRKLWNDTSLTLNAVAEALGVMPLTVSRHAFRLGLPYPRNTPRSLRAGGKLHKRLKITRGPLQDVLPTRRGKWLLVLESNPQASRRQLMDIAPAQWEWLRRNDTEWLEQQLPPPIKARPPIPRIDWASFDAELAVAVRAAALQILNAPGRPARVCQKAIARITGHKGRMQRRLDKMPLTAKVLSEFLETWDEFAIRRLKWAAEYFKTEGTNPKRYQLVELAGLTPKNEESQLVQEEIKAILQSFIDGTVTNLIHG